MHKARETGPFPPFNFSVLEGFLDGLRQFTKRKTSHSLECKNAISKAKNQSGW